MKKLSILLILFYAFLTVGCQEKEKTKASAPAKPKIVVTYSVLGSLVKDLAGDQFDVQVLIPNGLNVHEWEPSAKDVEAVQHASLIVENGINLEEGLSKTLEQARQSGVKTFTASNCIQVRHVGAGEGIPSDDPDQQLGAADPHLWLNPMNMKAILEALADTLQSTFHVDLSARSAALSKRLSALDSSMGASLSAIPPENRKLVTGHESMGYFAQHYQFKLIGAIIPSITTQAEVSASELAALKKQINENHVKTVFTEAGTPPKVAEALASEAHVQAVVIVTHKLPADGSYFTLMQDLAAAIVNGLK